MATSDSEDFESADEDLGAGGNKVRGSNLSQNVRKKHSYYGEVENDSEKFVENVNAAIKSDNAKISVHEVEKINEQVVHVALDRKLTISEKSVGGREKESVDAFNVKEKSAGGCKETEEGGTVEGWEDDLGDLDDEEMPSQTEEVLQKKEDPQIPEQEDVLTQKKGSPEREKFGTVLDRLTDTHQKEAVSSGGGWASWRGWGVSSLLSTATESVSTLTSHVSQGLTTVLEAGLGAPSPEELAKLDCEREQAMVQEQGSEDTASTTVEATEVKNEDGGSLFDFGRVVSGVSSITKLVETAGTKVVSGGLETLETIGKKTMDILQEGDPGLKKKRAYFSNNVLLSQVLREAKEKAEQENEERVDREAARKAHFETLFDDYQGLVHLEALEMLSKQCDLKLQSILLTSTGPALLDLQQTLNDLKEQCQLPEEEEEDVEDTPAAIQRKKLANVGEGLGVHVATDKLTKTWDETENWLENYRTKTDTEFPSARDVHENAMATMARLTAESVEQFHKAAELLLVLEERNPSEEAKILLDMTSVLCTVVSTAATRFSECLSTSPENTTDHEAVTSLITNIFLEAAHSSSYIQEAFQLLVPVLQVGLIVS